MSARFLPLLLAALLAAASTAHAASAYKDTTVTPRYARDRSVHFTHLRIAVTPDFKTRSVEGEVTHTFTPLRPVSSLSLDSDGLTILSATDAKGGALRYTAEESRLSVDLGGSHAPGETLAVTIRYRGTPDRGMYFSLPDLSRPMRPLQVYTQGESEDNHYWVPIWDSPNDKCASEMFVTAPRGMIAISNGRLVDVTPGPNGSSVYHWSESVPHCAYLNSLVIGDFKDIESSWEGISIHNYVKPADYARAKACVANVPDMMQYFSELTGQKYPYEKYSQTFVADFIHGGMENMSATTNTETNLSDARALLDQRPYNLQAHELAHQWFGDYLTCRDWAHSWLNEGFASYLQNLYVGHLLGPDELMQEVLGDQDSYFTFDETRYRRPIVENRYAAPEQAFDSHAYAKGAAVLHMLRMRLGDDAFWRGIRLYVSRFATQNVESWDLRRCLEEASGVSLEEFFNQWVRGAGYPEYRIRGEWRADQKTYVLTVRQAQRADGMTPVFTDPLEFEVWTAAGPKTYKFRMDKREATYALALDARPLNVRFDPRFAMLKKVEFTRTEAQLLFQLSHATDAWGRVNALRMLAKEAHSDSAAARIGETLKGDSFWGVKSAAAAALGEIRGERARALLIAGLGERASRVRRACATALGKFLRDPVAASALIRVARTDSSYAAQGEALVALARSRAPQAYLEATAGLTRASFNDVIQRNALEAIGETGELRGVAVARAWSSPTRSDGIRVSALGALGTLLRENRDAHELRPGELREQRDFIANVLLHARFFSVRQAAAEALSRCGDGTSIDVLQKAARSDADWRVCDRSERAIEQIRAGEGDRGDLRDLRRRLAEVETATRDEQRRIEHLEGANERR